MKFEIESRTKYEIEANTLKEAVRKILDNEVDPIDTDWHFFVKVQDNLTCAKKKKES